MFVAKRARFHFLPEGLTQHGIPSLFGRLRLAPGEYKRKRTDDQSHQGCHVAPIPDQKIEHRLSGSSHCSLPQDAADFKETSGLSPSAVAAVEAAPVLGGVRSRERVRTIAKGPEPAGSRVILRWLTVSRQLLPSGGTTQKFRNVWRRVARLNRLHPGHSTVFLQIRDSLARASYPRK